MTKSHDRKNLENKNEHGDSLGEPTSQLPNEDTFFADLITDLFHSQERKAVQKSVSGLSSVNAPMNHIKAQIRTKLLGSLLEEFEVPELVEGLVEYLADIVQEDPHQAKLFGLTD